MKVIFLAGVIGLTLAANDGNNVIGSANRVKGSNNFLIGDQHTTIGDSNIQIGFNTHVEGSGNRVVGANHKIKGDGIIMFGPDCNFPYESHSFQTNEDYGTDFSFDHGHSKNNGRHQNCNDGYSYGSYGHSKFNFAFLSPVKKNCPCCN